MPTLKPRISLTPSPDVYALISELSELEGRSRSAIVCDVLEAALVPLQSVRDVLRRASSIKPEQMAALESRLMEIQAQVQPVADDLFRVLSGLSKRGTNLDLFDDSDGINGGTPAASKDDAYPHLLIGGSVFPNSLKNKETRISSPGGSNDEI